MNRFANPILAALWLLMLPGCMSLPKIPWPWSRDRERAVAKAEAKVDTAREAVLRRAQGETTVAAVAIRAAPESRPVAVARDAINSAASLQAQALGPLTEAERQRLDALVADLLSENAEVRAAAERTRAKDLEENAKLAARLADVQAALGSAESKLRAAYQREKELADRYRSLVWTCVGIAVIAVLAAAAWLYVRVTTGGALSRIVGTIDRFKGDHPAIAPSLLESLSKALDRADKRLVKKVRSTQ